jgi:hypothetical protein
MIGKYPGKRQLGEPGIGGRIVLAWFFTKCVLNERPTF